MKLNFRKLRLFFIFVLAFPFISILVLSRSHYRNKSSNPSYQFTLYPSIINKFHMEKLGIADHSQGIPDFYYKDQLARIEHTQSGAILFTFNKNENELATKTRNDLVKKILTFYDVNLCSTSPDRFYTLMTFNYLKYYHFSGGLFEQLKNLNSISKDLDKSSLLEMCNMIRDNLGGEYVSPILFSSKSKSLQELQALQHLLLIYSLLLTVGFFVFYYIANKNHSPSRT